MLFLFYVKVYVCRLYCIVLYCITLYYNLIKNFQIKKKKKKNCSSNFMFKYSIYSPLRATDLSAVLTVSVNNRGFCPKSKFFKVFLARGQKSVIRCHICGAV